jgi:hypothetical protein
LIPNVLGSSPVYACYNIQERNAGGIAYHFFIFFFRGIRGSFSGGNGQLRRKARSRHGCYSILYPCHSAWNQDAER